MEPITFGAAYFFNEKYLNGYDKQENIPTREENETEFREHLAQTTGDAFISLPRYRHAFEAKKIDHPKLGLGYAVLTDTTTNNYDNYLENTESKWDVGTNGQTLIETLDEANERGELQKFNTFKNSKSRRQ